MWSSEPHLPYNSGSIIDDYPFLRILMTCCDTVASSFQSSDFPLLLRKSDTGVKCTYVSLCIDFWVKLTMTKSWIHRWLSISIWIKKIHTKPIHFFFYLIPFEEASDSFFKTFSKGVRGKYYLYWNSIIYHTNYCRLRGI